MKLYYMVVALGVYLGATFGVVGPYLISMKSTEAVLAGGVLVLLITPAVCWKLGFMIFNEANKIGKSKETTDEQDAN